ncbi:MAG: GAF domain-containing protein [Tabrizicola sp.]|uniref:GAF domain-containing protein n=1 Tax=Tabrizicola sp. TaxID=2005166 RepID=UPI0027353553|nr:GAF domain-containing protein [Tabrizicola sp.]MDP3265055.1 GAF domain-containing protein [Tabrizicola sp.]MDP3647402.1 GAF domain-containing protein [Paracoccaceae bacterium]MDZ4066392.1 GAF domain-containing protein [Tabrizicola sp.]
MTGAGGAIPADAGAAVSLDAIRDCFEGVVPATLATVDPAGVPNVSFISQVHYVDPGRVALSYQFFNKTRRNILSTRAASVEVIDPLTMACYQLDLDFETTEAEGPVFEMMKARLSGIASHTGMEGVFRLMGADVFRVSAIRRALEPRFARPVSSVAALPALRRILADMARATVLGELYDRTLDAIARHLGVTNLMILVPDETRGALDAVATWGYAVSGIGSEVRLGDGVIGVAARERVAIRIDHMSTDYLYGSAVRDRLRAEATPDSVEAFGGQGVAFPGLPRPESQIALPMLWQGHLTGVLFAESPMPMRFLHEEEDTLACIAAALATHAAALTAALSTADDEAEAMAAPAGAASYDTTVPLRHFKADDSVFAGGEYVIKGVAGAILWKLVRAYVATGCCEFTNRELRLSPELRLPTHAENLEARLVLLERRLREKQVPIQMEKVGRGRFRLVVRAALTLQEQ